MLRSDNRKSIHLDVCNRFEVAVRILQVDQAVVIGRSNGSLLSLQGLEDLPEELVVTERRVDGDGCAEHGGSDKYLDV